MGDDSDEGPTFEEVKEDEQQIENLQDSIQIVEENPIDVEPSNTKVEVPEVI